MYKGSCLCGAVKFEVRSEPKKVSHCHCNMCQKQHGAAFATYGSLPKSDLVYTNGLDILKSYNSSGTIARKFCGSCGSSIEWCGSEEYPDWTSVAISTFDTPYKPSKEIIEIYTESKFCWLNQLTSA